MGDRHDTGTMTGKVDFSTGAVVFQLDTQAEINDGGIILTINMTYLGDGRLDSPSTASGDTKWTLVCSNPGGGSLACGKPGGPREFFSTVTGMTKWKL